MDNTRITISMEQRERSALMRLARVELRSPRDQARYIIRRELEDLGFLAPSLDEPGRISTTNVCSTYKRPIGPIEDGGQGQGGEDNRYEGET